MSQKMSRAEVEQKLQRKGEEISGRFENIESQIPGRKNAIVKAVREKKGLKIGMAVGAGLLVGMMLFRRKSSRDRFDYGDGLDRLSTKLTRKIHGFMDRGEAPEDAVRKALGDVPPLMSFSEENDGILTGALKQLARTGTSILAAELSEYLKSRLSKEEDQNSEK